MRKEGWEVRLSNYLEDAVKQPFEWGKCDCLIFASDACIAVCGIDPMNKKKKNDPETIRGLYKSETEAKELIKKYRKSIREIMDLHFPRKNKNFATKGDVVLYQNAFGVCAGRGIAFLKDENSGLTEVKISDCALAWDI